MSYFESISEFEAAIDENNVDLVGLNIHCLSDHHLIRAIECGSHNVVDFLEMYLRNFNSMQHVYQKLANLALRGRHWRAFEYFLNRGHTLHIFEHIDSPLSFNWSTLLRLYRVPKVFDHKLGAPWQHHSENHALGLPSYPGQMWQSRPIKKIKLEKLIKKEIHAIRIGLDSLNLPRLLQIQVCKTAAEPFSNCLTEYEIEILLATA